ncbi:MAG: hypothetical protein IT434_10160 [Phycisphaerales bacterium]|nr:hypothetical protein [Phycisphaerales bacterium]
MLCQLFAHYRDLKVLEEDKDMYRAVATIEAAAAAQTTRYLQDPSKADDIEALRKEYEKEHVKRVRKCQRLLQDPPSAMTRFAWWAADLLRHR